MSLPDKTGLLVTKELVLCKDQGNPHNVDRSGAVLEVHVRTEGNSRT